MKFTQKNIITLSVCALFGALSFTVAPGAHALACASSYPQKRDLSARVLVNMKLLNAACEAKSSVVGAVKKGEVVKVTARAGNWYQVIAVDGKVGWAPKANFKWGNYKLTNPESVALAKKGEEEEVKKTAQAGKLSSSTLTKMKGRILASLTDSTKLFYYDAASGKLIPIGTVEELKVLSDRSEKGAEKGTFVKNEKGVMLYIHPDTGKAYAIEMNAKGLELLRSFAMSLTDKMLAEIDPTSSHAAVAVTVGEQAPALPQ